MPAIFKPVRTAPPASQLSQFTATAYQISADAAGELNYSSMFQSSASGTYYYYFIEVAAIVPQLVDAPPPSSGSQELAQGSIWGVGFRIYIQAFNVDVKFTSTLDQLAVGASLKVGSTQAQAELIGGFTSSRLETALSDLLNTAQPFSAETLNTLGQAANAFQLSLTDPNAQITLAQMYVAVEPNSFSYTSLTLSAIQAWNSINAKRNLYQAYDSVQSSPMTNQFPIIPIRMQDAYLEAYTGRDMPTTNYDTQVPLYGAWQIAQEQLKPGIKVGK